MRNLRVLWNTVVVHRWTLLLLGVLSALGALVQTAVIVIIVQTAVAVSRGDEAAHLNIGPLVRDDLSIRGMLSAGGVLLVLLLALTWVTSRQGASIASSILRTERAGYLRLFLHAPLVEQRRGGSGPFQELLTNFTQRQAQLAVVGVSLIVCTLNLVVLVAAAVVSSPLAGASIVVGAGLLSLLSQPLTRRRKAFAHRQVSSSVRFAGAVNEAYRAAREIRVFGVRDPVQGRLESLNGEVARNYAGLVFLTRFAPSAFQYAGFGLLLMALAFLAGQPSTRASSLGASLVLILRALTYAQGLQTALNSLGEAAPYVLRLREQRLSWTPDTEPEGVLPFPPLESLRLEQVTFSHEPGHPVLRRVSLTARRGRMTGLCGPSGSGKSTIAMLLLRLWQPESGRVLVNDVPIDRISRDDYHRHVAFVPQDPVLVEGTVRDNVRFFRGDISDDEIDHALGAVGLVGELTLLPDGAGTKLDQDGAGLSGGQRQRLCLARALAGRPSAVILDEPTSALDDMSAEQVVRTLRGLRGEVTLVVVSHQDAVLSLCDDVVTVREGRIEHVPASP